MLWIWKLLVHIVLFVCVVYVDACTRVHACGDQRIILYIFLHHFLPYCLETVPHWTGSPLIWLTWLIRPQSGSVCLCHPILGSQACTAMPGFLCQTWIWTHVCTRAIAHSAVSSDHLYNFKGLIYNFCWMGLKSNHRAIGHHQGIHAHLDP